MNGLNLLTFFGKATRIDLALKYVTSIYRANMVSSHT